MARRASCGDASLPRLATRRASFAPSSAQIVVATLQDIEPVPAVSRIRSDSSSSTRERIELPESPPSAILQKTSGSSRYLAEHVRRRERQLAGSADLSAATHDTEPVPTETATRPVSWPSYKNQHASPPGLERTAQTPTLPRSLSRRVSLASSPVPTRPTALAGASSQAQLGTLPIRRGMHKLSGGARYSADVVRRRKVKPDTTKATVPVHSLSLLVSLAFTSLSPQSKIMALIIASLFGMLILIWTTV